MCLGTDEVDGREASVPSRLMKPRLPCRRYGLNHVSTEAKIACSTSARDGQGHRWMSSAFKVAKKVSATALSRQVPGLPMQPVMVTVHGVMAG